jgi:beta-phosphoglucomutase-like phosphatase (HAD superfamily)
VLVDALVTSEEAGATKPDGRIFETALDRLGITPAQAVMVGDAWSTDIEGAIAAAIRPVWFNRCAAPSPDPTVAELTALEPTAHAVAVIRGDMQGWTSAAASGQAGRRAFGRYCFVVTRPGSQVRSGTP